MINAEASANDARWHAPISRLRPEMASPPALRWLVRSLLCLVW